MTENKAVFGSDLIVAIAVDNLDIARFKDASPLFEFGCIFQLPDTIGLIIIEYFHGLADKPFISFVVDFPVIEFHDLLLVDGEHEVGRPFEIFRIDIDRIQGYFQTFVADLPDIGRHIAKTGNNRQLAVHQEVVRILKIQIHAPPYPAVQETEIDTGVPLFGLFP